MKYDGYMQTFTGSKFYPAKPSWYQINIDDIAHALSHICRYSGHSKEFYSVAEHCLVMADFFPAYRGLALFHDAAEAYMGDLPRPIKTLNPEYKLQEHKLLNIILDMANLTLSPENLDIIAKMDNFMLAHERLSPKIMQNRTNISWGEEIDYICTTINPVHDFACYSPQEVEVLFKEALYDHVYAQIKF